MEVKKEETNLAIETAKQTLFQLVVEIVLSVIFGDIVSKLTGGLAFIIGGPIIYYFNSEQTIGVIVGIGFPLIGLLMVISEIRDIIKDIKKNQKTKS